MKRALIVAPSYPYPVDGGNRVALHGYRVALQAAGFEHIDFIGFKESQRDGDEFSRLVLVEKPAKLTVRSVLRYAIGHSLLMARYHSVEFSKSLAALCREHQYDVVLFQHGYMCQYQAEVRQILPRAKFVASAEVLESRAYRVKANLEKNAFKKLLLNREADFLDKEETASFDGFDQVTFFSDEDLSHYKAQGGLAAGVQINLGLDMEKYKPLKMPSNARFVATFFGSFSWFANLDALDFLLKDVWPAVVAENPDAVLKLAGRDIPEWAHSHASSSVQILGKVPSIADLIASSHVVLSPIRIGGGVRLKMLESLAYGRQVISTSIGLEGLEKDLAKCIRVADSPSDFAKIIKELGSAKEGSEEQAMDACLQVHARYNARNLAWLFETPLSV